MGARFVCNGEVTDLNGEPLWASEDEVRQDFLVNTVTPPVVVFVRQGPSPFVELLFDLESIEWNKHVLACDKHSSSEKFIAWAELELLKEKYADA